MKKYTIWTLIGVFFLTTASVTLCACSGGGGDPAPGVGGTVTNTDTGSTDEDPADDLFDPDYMIAVEIEMDLDDWVSLNNDSRFGADLSEDEMWGEFYGLFDRCHEPWPNEYTWFEASATVDGETLDQVGVRRKGFIGSLYAPVPAMKIKTDKFVDGQFLGDTERITLNSGWAELAAVRTCLTFEVFSAAGHPAPRCNLANVWVNGQHLGAYAHVEAIKKRFLAYAFGDNSGSLYEGTHTDFVEAWLPRWEIKTDDTDPTYAPLLAIADALQVSDEKLVAALEPVLNIERYITFWALEVITNHTDGYSSDHNNFYVYFDPMDNDRAVFIPWGVDEAFGYSLSLKTALNAHLPRRLSRIPAIAEAMADELERIRTDVWDTDAILERIDTLEAQLEIAGDGNAAAVEKLRTWVQEQPGDIAKLLEAGVPAGADKMSWCSE
jgi:spore coat protein H